MKTIQKTFYECEKCGEKYETADQAVYCEKQPITQNKGVKIGDIITIINGDSKGKQAKVTRTFIYDKEWGHYAWRRYWHTVGVVADIVGDWGSRQLTFDDYEV